jgi:hypothetical protein
MLDVHDDRPHLTDDQLRAPMRDVMSKCAVPKKAKVNIRTAVQHGRATGVSVDVQFDHGKPPPTPPKRLSRAAAQRAAALAKQEAKARKKIAACFDRVVRGVVWPPSSRRDSFTTEF